MSYLDKKDIVEAFKKCGIQQGSVLMLHSDAIFLAQTRHMPKEDRYALLFEALNEVLGPEGTLIIPTFTYSATKGELFTVEETPSTVGELTEYFRKLPDVQRSRDPIFSVAVRGKKVEKFANAEVGDTFGEDSIFGLLDRHDAWIACLACSFDRITYTHYVEQKAGVDYRYFKNFTYEIVKKNEKERNTVRYFVRDLKRESTIKLDLLKARLEKIDKLYQSEMGKFLLSCVQSKIFRDEAKRLLMKKNNALILEGSSLN